MNKSQELTYNVTAQTLIWECPEGRPSSVTGVKIWENDDGDDDTEQTAPGTGAAETNPATTISATSGYGQSDPTLITVTLNTGITVGRTYLLTNTSGEKEWVTIKGVSGTSVYVHAPLKNEFLNTSTFQSTRITSVINATWIADDDNISDALLLTPGYRVRWSYVVSSVTYVHDGYFDVVRYPWVHTVTEADMRSYVPDWDDRLPTEHREDGGARLIERASQGVKWDLKRAGIDAALLRHSEARDELVMGYAWILLERPGSDGKLAAEDKYNTLMDGILRISRKVPVAADDSGAGYMTKPKGLWSK
jgi:hypothetical protein